MNFIKLIIICLLFSEIAIAGERFPLIKTNCTGMLQVDAVHSIYWEESGNPNGVPVLFLHGGPGVGTTPNDRTYFDPTFYRIILFDQRGCGKSIPNGQLIGNTTWDLLEDINKLRQELKIDRCVLFGGSWGTTLALTYAIQYPENVIGIILRSVFLSEQQELDWFFKEGANQLDSKAWKNFSEGIPEDNRDNLLFGYRQALDSEKSWERYHAAASWVMWELANLSSDPDHLLSALLNNDALFYPFMLLYAKKNHTMASIENHYFLNKCFFESDSWILDHIDRIKDIPGIIVQGEKDQICPWENAYKLHKLWTHSSFILVPDAGHLSTEKGVLESLIDATNSFKEILQLTAEKKEIEN